MSWGTRAQYARTPLVASEDPGLDQDLEVVIGSHSSGAQHVPATGRPGQSWVLAEVLT